jgi:hypothetical protein
VALAYLLDENLRGPMWRAIQHHNAGGGEPLDALCVGDPPAPPLGTPDPELLRWAESQGRILVSQDRHTMPGHFAAHLQSGGRSAGVFLLVPTWKVATVLAALIRRHQTNDPQDYVETIIFIP